MVLVFFIIASAHKNIILSYGLEKSILIYKDAEQKLIDLLLKYNLMTNTFEQLINKLNKKFNKIL